MKRAYVPDWLAVPLLAMALLVPAALSAEEEAKEIPQYIGVENCALCHKREATGDQLGHWQASKHAKAYETLAGAKAKEIATAKGIADPQKAEQCLKCHVSQAAPELIAEATRDKQFVMEDGVQCETCHGPGSLYKSRKVMQDRAASISYGLVIPDKALCLSCHNEESPTFKGFDFEAMYAKIAHPNPKTSDDAEE